MALDKARIARQIKAVRVGRPTGASRALDKGSRGDLLPFSKPKNTTEAIELGDDDLVLVEEPDVASLSSRPGARRPRKLTPAGSRRVLDEAVEEDVAGECLASIAETRDHHSSSHVRAVAARPAAGHRSMSPPAHASSASCAPASAFAPVGLPPVSPPPFVRSMSVPRIAHGGASSAAARESSPPSAFVRRSSPTIPPIGAASSSAVAEPSAGSVAPLSLSPGHAESSVVVVRERPKLGWVIGAAAIGALCAFGATRLLASGAPPEEHAAPSAASTVAVPSVGTAASPGAALTPLAPPVVGPPPVAPPSAVVAPGPSVAVMRFGDDQGVAIKRSPRAPVPAPAVASAVAKAVPLRPRTSAASGGVGPALPDGTFGLGASDGASVTTTAPPAPPPAPVAPPPESAKKRALTPEQQLAEAQLKASMR